MMFYHFNAALKYQTQFRKIEGRKKIDKIKADCLHEFAIKKFYKLFYYYYKQPLSIYFY